MDQNIKQTILEAKRLLQEAEKKINDTQGPVGPSTSSDIGEEDRALQNFRQCFPAMSSRKYQHKEYRKMLQDVPYPIKESWTHEFCCIPFRSQEKTPSAHQADLIKKAGLGRTKITFEDKLAKHADFCRVIEEQFPQLLNAGGYTLHRAKTGGQNRPLYQLDCRWYNIKDIKKEVTGSACIYLRPVQNDLDLKAAKPITIRDGPTVVCKGCKMEVPIVSFRRHECVAETLPGASGDIAHEIIEVDDVPITEPITATAATNDRVVSFQNSLAFEGLVDDSDSLSEFDPDTFMVQTTKERRSLYNVDNDERLDLIGQQDLAYQESLDADKQKEMEEQASTENKERMEAEARTIYEAAVRKTNEHRDSCRRKVVAEPNEGPNVLPLKFRLPNGETKRRRFQRTCDVEVVLSFVGSQDESTPRFHIQSLSTPIVRSNTRRRSLEDIGITMPCTFNVVWEGLEMEGQHQDSQVIDALQVDAQETSLSEESVPEPEPPFIINVRKTFIVADMVTAFKNENLLEKKLEVKPINQRGEIEEADDFGGVFRDILSAFWSEFLKGHANGESEMLPSLRHDFGAEEWKAICRIVVAGYKELQYLPIKLSKSFLIACHFGEKAVSADLLLDSLLLYIPLEDKDALQKSLGKNQLDLCEEDKDVLDTLESLSSKRIPKSGTELRNLLLELAHTEVIQRPSYVREAWEEILKSFPIFKDMAELMNVYSKCQPTAKKILQLLHAEPASDGERQSYDYLKRFVRTLRKEDVAPFLRFTTGADVVCVEKINVIFNKTDGLSRRPIAHTCGPSLELSINYECFAQFKEEFLTVLNSGYWNMDFA